MDLKFKEHWKFLNYFLDLSIGFFFFIFFFSKPSNVHVSVVLKSEKWEECRIIDMATDIGLLA